MPLVNILQILIVLSMIKIIYSHKFMMEKVFNINSSLSKCKYFQVYIFKKREILKQTKQVSQQSNKLFFLSAYVSIAFKIIVKLDYLEK